MFVGFLFESAAPLAVLCVRKSQLSPHFKDRLNLRSWIVSFQTLSKDISIILITITEKYIFTHVFEVKR